MVVFPEDRDFLAGFGKNGLLAEWGVLIGGVGAQMRTAAVRMLAMSF